MTPNVPRQEPEMMLAVAEARIAWVLDHPHMSDWLKQVLRTANTVDPITMQNDVEMLKYLLIPHAQARIELALSSVLPA